MRPIVFLMASVCFAACAASGTRTLPSRRPEAATVASKLPRARELAKQYIILDGHIDAPYRLHANPADITKKSAVGDFDIPRAFEGGLDAPFFSIYTAADLEEKGGSKKLADELIRLVENIIQKSPGEVEAARTAADARRIAASGKLAIFMGMENGSPIEKNIDNVDYFFDRGIRYITLCHGKDNHICDSSYDTTRTWKGLSPFGRDVVKRMNATGIMIDVSHISDDTFLDVMELSEAPVIASHSSCRHFTPGFERNMSDEMIRKLAEKGGVIQINFGSTFIRDDVRLKSAPVWKKVSDYIKEKGISEDSAGAQAHQKKVFADAGIVMAEVADVADHIEHVIRLVGVDYVGFGSDFDGVGDTLPTGLKDVSMYPNLIAELLARGISESDIEKICGGNVLRVMEEVEHIASHR